MIMNDKIVFIKKIFFIGVIILCSSISMIYSASIDYLNIAKIMCRDRCLDASKVKSINRYANYYDSYYGDESIAVNIDDESLASFPDIVTINVIVQKAKNDIPIEKLVQEKSFSAYMLQQEDRRKLIELEDELKSMRIVHREKTNGQKEADCEQSKYEKRKIETLQSICKNVRIQRPNCIYYKVKYEDPAEMKKLSLQYLKQIFPGREWRFNRCSGGSYALVAKKIISVGIYTCPEIVYSWFRVEDGVCIGNSIQVGIDPRNGSLTCCAFNRNSIEGVLNKELLSELTEEEVLQKGRKQYCQRLRTRVRHRLSKYFENDKKLKDYMDKNWDQIFNEKILPLCQEEVLLNYQFKDRYSLCFLGCKTKKEILERARAIDWSKYAESDTTWNRELLQYDYRIVEENQIERVSEVFSFDAISGRMFYDDTQFFPVLYRSKYVFERFGEYSFKEVSSDDFNRIRNSLTNNNNWMNEIIRDIEKKRSE